MSARKYLDISGLSALWTKIKNKFAEPVELTQAEYDQLSTAEKNNGKLYFITDATQGGIIDDSTTTSQTKTWSAYNINNSKVSKSGDTMTGALTIGSSTYNKCWIKIKNEHIHSQSAAPTNDILGGGLYSQDNENWANTHVSLNYNSDGNITSILGTLRLIGNSPSIESYYNEIKLKIDGSGNKSVEVTSPSAWRTALGLATVASSGNYNDLTNKPTIPDISTKVSKTGDTMTGVLSYKATNVDASKANNNVSSTQYPTTFNITDNAGRIISRKEGIVQSDGQIGSYWYTRNYNTSGGQVAQKGIRMMMNKSGALTWSVDDAASFRSAIGLYYEEQNGYANCCSANRGCTVNFIKCVRVGKMVTCTFFFSDSTAQTGGVAYVALKSQFRPAERIFFPVNIVGSSSAYANESCHRMYLYNDGTMKLNIEGGTGNTVTQVMGSVSYCIN